MTTVTPDHNDASLPDNLTAPGSAVLEEDRRVSTRLPIQIDANLLGLNGSEVVRCTTDDLCENGLFFRVPVGYGLAVGQRYEVIFADSQNCQLFANVAGETRYATILRTEMPFGDDPECVGIGMRFDQPLLL